VRIIESGEDGQRNGEHDCGGGDVWESSEGGSVNEQEHTSWSEEEFLQVVKDLAQAFNWKIYHTRDSRRSDPGFPDLAMVRAQPAPARILFAELKTAKGKLTKAQDEWLEELRAGCKEVYLWRPDDIQEIAEILR